MTDDRIAALEARLQLLEDKQQITDAIASYGPLVDGGHAEQVGALWTEDGVYDVEGYDDMDSRAGIEAMVRSDAHQGLIGAGCSHFLGPAHVRVDGDTAVAVCESVLIVRHKDRPVVARIGVNHFELKRTEDGWLTTRRTTRSLDGSDETRRLLGSVAAGA